MHYEIFKKYLLIHYPNSNNKRCMNTYTSTCNCSFNHGIIYTSLNTQNQRLYPTSLYVGDIDGDDKSDLVAKWKNSNNNNFNIYVYRGKDNASFRSATSKSTSLQFYLG